MTNPLKTNKNNLNTRKLQNEIRFINTIIFAFFIIFMLLPLGKLFMKSMDLDGMGLMKNYVTVFSDARYAQAIFNTAIVAFVSASITIILAFTLAYAIHMTNIKTQLKRFIKVSVILPMFLPTITYGFAIMYSFGKQGLISKAIGFVPFEIYGFNGLVIGYVIYTLPPIFLLLNNSFRYVDKELIIVSRLMQDSKLKSTMNAVVRPLFTTLAGAFVLSFVMCATDYGIPASISGTYEVFSTLLYEMMMGAIPDFGAGSVLSIIMLMPALFSVYILNRLEKYQIASKKMHTSLVERGRIRDTVFAGGALLIIATILSVFMVMFIVPFVESWPYNLAPTLKHFKSIMASSGLQKVYVNSLGVAGSTALIGTAIAYMFALLSTRTNLGPKTKRGIDLLALIPNSIPGMVLGIAFLFLFAGTPIHNTFAIVVIANIIHFFSTPFMMCKNILAKLNITWETTGELLGDTFFKTLIRVVIPNSSTTLIEVFAYYFTNSMVTISAVIFLSSARTTLLTVRIKELQHLAKFDEIFIVSILIFATNIIVRLVCEDIHDRLAKRLQGA